jgi:hypothetical protein
MMNYGYGIWALVIGILITLVVLGGLVWLVVWAVRKTSSGSREAKLPASSTNR